ncbi:hypothetical protein LDL36_20140 [Komagataeibacter sp. FNDCR1]|nr:hypothetical protein [Komagataeibacter sp. FNDCR1]
MTDNKTHDKHEVSVEEGRILRCVINRIEFMLRYYNLRLEYSVDVKKNSFTTQISPNGLDPVGVLMRLKRHDELEDILASIVNATDPKSKEHAIQRGRCVLNSQALHAVD